MMISLFSVFDPISYFGVSLNWIIMVLLIFFIPLKYFYIESNYKMFVSWFYCFVRDMFKGIGGENHLGLVFVSLITFLYISIGNLMGLFPFVFTFSAHPMITMGVGVVVWVSFFLMGFLKNFGNSVAHLVPKGSPLILSPMLVIVESISHMIRPFTLSIRLAANMVAGHLIVGLLSSISLINMFGFSCSFFLQSILLVLEFGVAVIQGFVFSILMMLYALDYY